MPVNDIENSGHEFSSQDLANMRVDPKFLNEDNVMGIYTIPEEFILSNEEIEEGNETQIQQGGGT